MSARDVVGAVPDSVCAGANRDLIRTRVDLPEGARLENIVSCATSGIPDILWVFSSLICVVPFRILMVLGMGIPMIFGQLLLGQVPCGQQGVQLFRVSHAVGFLLGVLRAPPVGAAVPVGRGPVSVEAPAGA